MSDMPNVGDIVRLANVTWKVIDVGHNTPTSVTLQLVDAPDVSRFARLASALDGPVILDAQASELR